MDNRRLERIEVKIDDQNEHLSSIDVTLAQQHESLRIHMKRSELLEKEFKPIRRFVYMIQGCIALITLLATIIGVYAVFK